MRHPLPGIFTATNRFRSTLAGLLLAVPALAAPPPGALKSEMIAEPMGLHTAAPRLSWIVSDPSTGARQTAWQVQAASAPDRFDPPDLWDSGMVKSDQSHLVPYGGARPVARQRVHWRVRSWDRNGNPSAWSKPSAFEMGLLDSSDWAARWIKPGRYSFVDSELTARWLEHAVLRTPGGMGAARDAEVMESLDILREARPLVVARKSFDIGEAPGEARLYLAALGFARVLINGRAVSDEWNTPAPTHYKIAARYKVFDVTGLLRQGTNTVAVELAAGKYKETPGNHVRPYGDRPAVKLQLEFIEGGRRVTLGTDESWQFQLDPRHQVVSFWAGDVWDASSADPAAPDHDPGGSVLGTLLSAEDEPKRLLPMLIPPESTRENLRPVNQWQIADEVWVFDFGRTVVGRVQLDLPAADGRTYVVRYSDSLRNHYRAEYEDILTRPAYPGREVAESAVSLGLKRRGNILFRNVEGRSIYTGVPTEVFASPPAGTACFAPRSGMVPFRYLEIIGFDQEPAPGTVSANIAHTALERTGSFTSSDENLNRIHEAVVRTLLYNAHAFYYDNNGAEKGFWPHTYGMNLPHFAFNCEVAAYTSYIIEEVDLFTREEGFTTTALSGRRGEKGAGKFGFLSDGDYHLKLPYLHYLYSGDGKPLATHADLADSFVHDWWFAGRFPTPFRVDHYGDHTANSANLDVPASAFLNPPTKGIKGSVNQNNIASELSCTIYASHLLDLAATLSDLRGDPQEAARRRAKRDETKEAIRGKYYWNSDYGYAVDSLSAQGPNAGMIFYQVAPPSEHPDLVRAIREDIQRWNNHLSTGSRLTYAMFSVLSSHGFLDQAVEMLTTRRYPSFLSMLDYADTLSESWPMPDAPATTSHCQTEGYSEIGKWFWLDLHGIQPDHDKPGFKHFFVNPRFPAKLDSADAGFHSPYGPVASAWTREGNSIHWNLTIPWNASATVSLPEFEPRRIRLNHEAVGSNTFTVSAGIHRIEVRHVGGVLRSSAADNRSSPLLRATELKSDYRINPLGIDRRPNLSWRMEAGGRHGAAQTAYRIRSAASADHLGAGNIVWDSGLVESDAATQIAYGGPDLKPGERVWWQVMIRDENGMTSDWSAPAWFEAGLLSDENWHDAQWIGCDRDFESPQMAPMERMGDWIAPPKGQPVISLFKDIELPDQPVVSAIAWWGLSKRVGHAAVAANYDATAGFVRGRLNRIRTPRLGGFVDMAFYLQPGRVNRIELRLDQPASGFAATVGMLIVLADGSEIVLRSGADWMARQESGETQAVAVAEPYGGTKYGEAQQFFHTDLPPAWFRGTVRVRPGLKRARLYVSALGQGQGYVNGKPLDDTLLNPPQSDYEDFAFYTVHDITGLLQRGDNAISILLDPGWYHQIGGFGHGSSYGRPGLKALAMLEYADGSTERMVSGPEWQWKEGAIRSANIYRGERVDFRLDHEEWKTPGAGRGWKAAQVLAPRSPMTMAMDVIPIRRGATLKPVQVWQTGPKSWLVDIGEVIHGWVRFSMQEPDGATVRLRYSEHARDGVIENVPVSHWWCHGLPQSDEIISDGNARVFEPLFTPKSFRYVELSGLGRLPDDLVAHTVHTDARPLAKFESSDPMLNRLFENGMRTWRNYMNHMLGDLPRERCLWGAESIYGEVPSSYGYDFVTNHRLMNRVWLTGTMTPEGIPGNIGVGKRLSNVTSGYIWSVSPLFISSKLLEHYGDPDPARRYYDGLRRLVLEYPLEHGELDGTIPAPHTLSDHAPVKDVKRNPTDGRLLTAMVYFEALNRFARIADALDRPQDASAARSHAEKVRATVMTFYDAANHTFGNGTQDSLALAYELITDPPEAERLAASLAGWYRANGHQFDGGFLSYEIYPMLSKHGHADDAVRILVNTGPPGPASSVRNYDATTFWETYYADYDFQMNRGLNFIAFAHTTGWMVNDLAGIRYETGAPNGKRLVLAPRLPREETLSRVDGSLEIPAGTVRSAWIQRNGRLHWEFTVPANVTAEVRIPAQDGTKIRGAETMRLLGREDGCAVYEAIAGSYAVRSRPGQPKGGRIEH